MLAMTSNAPVLVNESSAALCGSGGCCACSQLLWRLTDRVEMSAPRIVARCALSGGSQEEDRFTSTFGLGRLASNSECGYGDASSPLRKVSKKSSIGSTSPVLLVTRRHDERIFNSTCCPATWYFPDAKRSNLAASPGNERQSNRWASSSPQSKESSCNEDRRFALALLNIPCETEFTGNGHRGKGGTAPTALQSPRPRPSRTCTPLFFEFGDTLPSVLLLLGLLWGGLVCSCLNGDIRGEHTELPLSMNTFLGDQQGPAA